MYHFNYCQTVWNSCGKVNNDKLETIQYQAFKFIYYDLEFSYESLLTKAGLKPLFVLRQIGIIVEVFQSLLGLCHIYVSNILCVKSSTYNLRNHNSLQLYHSRTNYGLHSFRHIGAKLWNDLPHHVKSMSDICVFNESLYRHFTGFK